MSDRDYTFLHRFGATILSGGIAAIPRALYRYQAELELSPQLVWFVSAILCHMWDEALPYPSLSRMALDTGVSRRQLQRYEEELHKRGMLEVIPRKNAAGGIDANAYDFSGLFAMLGDLLTRDKTPVTPASNPPVTSASSRTVTTESQLKESVRKKKQNGDISKTATKESDAHAKWRNDGEQYAGWIADVLEQ